MFLAGWFSFSLFQALAVPRETLRGGREKRNTGEGGGGRWGLASFPIDSKV